MSLIRLTEGMADAEKRGKYTRRDFLFTVPLTLAASELYAQEKKHDEIQGIQHIDTIPVTKDKKCFSVICGQPKDHNQMPFSKYTDTMTFYHILSNEPLAKKLELKEGQTAIYFSDGKEMCRVDSTFIGDMVFEPAHHYYPDKVTPPKACKNALKEGKKAPDFEYQVFGSEKKISLKGLEGKIVLLDIGATWCGPCMKLKPYLEEVKENYPQIEFIWLSVDQDPAKLKEYIKNNKSTFDYIVNDSLWTKSPTIKAYQVVGVPDVYLIGQDGTIAGRNIHWDQDKQIFTTEKLEAKIKELLKKK